MRSDKDTCSCADCLTEELVHYRLNGGAGKDTYGVSLKLILDLYRKMPQLEEPCKRKVP